MPTELISHLEFGGDDLRTLFVTSGSVPEDIFTGAVIDQQLSPSAGKLFMVKGLCAKGLPANNLCV